MNRAYRVIFNHSLGVWQCVSEIAKAKGKSKTLKTVVLAAAVAVSGQALANEVFGGGIQYKNRGDYQVTAPTEVLTQGTVLPTNTLTVDNQPLTIYNHGKVTNTKDVKVQNGGKINIHTNGVLETESINIGSVGAGELTVDNGTVKTTGNTNIAKEKGSKGELTLANNAKFTTKDLKVGTFGEATLKVTNSQLDTEAVISGFGKDSKVDITLDKATVNTGLLTLGAAGKTKFTADNQSKLNVDGNLFVSSSLGIKQEQESVSGELIIQNGSNVTVKNTLAVGSTGKGRLEIAGENTTIKTNDIQIGGWLPANIDVTDKPQQYGDGTLEVKSKANVLVEKDVVIGNLNKGQVTVDGAKVKVKRNTIIAETQASMGTLNIKNGVYETDDLVVSQAGTGKLNTNNSQINAKSFRLGVGQEAIADALIDNSTINATGTIILGHYGKAKLTATNASTIVGENLYLFSGVSPIQKRDSVSDELIVNKGSNVSINNVLGIGNTGGAKVAVSGERSAINVGGEIQIGGWLPDNVDDSGISQSSGNGTLEVKDGASVLAKKDIVIGNIGVGKAQITQATAETEKNTILGKEKDSTGELNINKKGVYTTGDLVVGNKGSGKLVVNTATVKVANIKRDTAAQASSVSIVDGTVQLTENQGELFDGFTDKSKSQIELGGNAIFDTQNHNATIVNGARLIGTGSLIKQGAGTLTLNVASKGYTGQTHINEGTLKLLGDYEFAKDEILAIAVENKDKYGKLESTGKLNVTKGTIKIKASSVVQQLASDAKDANQNANTVWKDIVKAEGLVGQFKEFSVVGKEDKPIRNGTDLLHLDYHGNAIDLKVGAPKQPEQKQPEQKQPEQKQPEQKQPEQKQPTSVFTKAVQKHNNISALSLAQALDKTIESPNEQNKKLALALSLGLDGLSQAQISQAASQLQPLLEGATNRVIADSSAYAVQAINAQPLTSTHQVWASAIGNDGKHKASTTGLSAYNDTHVGAVVGVQGAVGETSVGVAVSHLQGDIDSKGATNHQVETKTTQALLYAKHQAAQGTELYGHVGVGRSDVDGKRHISLLAKTTATAQYQAKIAQAGLGISHQIGSSQRNLTPFVGIDYTKVSSDAYQEKGAGVYNLAVNKNTYESLTSTLGVKANYTIGKLNLNATLAGGFENGDKRSRAQASFVSSNVGFSTTGHEVGKHFGVAGVGVGYQLTPKAKLSLGYQGQWRKNYDSQSGTLALTMQF
ncbi:autotransporter domain-containing protein [Moraxella sp. VT-16-12]|uniref:autotransporter domain-containing protein n=1 Tax=Moraxella sp. VT-16-12 TaxID=2014877 RepID=UPI0011B7AD03|nr:autotransporter domain-containing protein [Moraxella sp. VT-16-12]TWV83927.1 autotransporter domain-containing protein [Moraxella sp. VT-16-12]